MEDGERFAPIAALLGERQYADAYIWFREHQGQFSRREQRLLRALLTGQLWRAPVLLAVLTVVLQAVAGGIFANQVQDMFAFLGRTFRPYMYVATVIPLLMNLGLAVLLGVQFYERLALLTQVFGRCPHRRRIAASVLGVVLLAGWSVYALVPYAKDLPLVISGSWNTALVTRAQEESAAKANALTSYTRPAGTDFTVTPWYYNPRWSDLLMPIMPGLYNRWVCHIHVDGVTCRMGMIQFRMTDYQIGEYPVRVEYLPNSKLVLWISCGEE